jgi:hypothetical protein
MEMWGTNYVDMLGPAYIQIDDAGSEMTFAAVQIGLRYEYGETSIWFRFNGSDEMDEVSGDGDAELAENGTLNGEIRFDNDRRKLIYRKTMVNFRSLLERENAARGSGFEGADIDHLTDGCDQLVVKVSDFHEELRQIFPVARGAGANAGQHVVGEVELGAQVRRARCDELNMG